MGYKYREVICPYCHHKFMWQQSVQEGSTWAEYTDKITKEICLSAKCPECSKKIRAKWNRFYFAPFAYRKY